LASPADADESGSAAAERGVEIEAGLVVVGDGILLLSAEAVVEVEAHDVLVGLGAGVEGVGGGLLALRLKRRSQRLIGGILRGSGSDKALVVLTLDAAVDLGELAGKKRTSLFT